MQIRTDLAIDEHKRINGECEGVTVREQNLMGLPVTTVEVTTAEAAQKLHKPIGTYVTVTVSALRFSESVSVLSGQLGRMLQAPKKTLAVGLGNEAVTPDAVGPMCLKNLLVTRHLPRTFGFSSVCAMEPGVLGNTGMESAESVRAIVDAIRPTQLIVFDALATDSPERICSTVQLTDTGIIPGSGVGNSRAAFTRQSLGVPVLAVGVPTVVDAGRPEFADFMLTPRDIDRRIRELAKIVGYACNLTLHHGLSLHDISCFLP